MKIVSKFMTFTTQFRSTTSKICNLNFEKINHSSNNSGLHTLTISQRVSCFKLTKTKAIKIILYSKAYLAFSQAKNNKNKQNLMHHLNNFHKNSNPSTKSQTPMYGDLQARVKHS